MGRRIKMKKQNLKSKKGFTLLEVIVALFVFSLVIASSTVVFANMFKGVSSARQIQQNLDNIQHTMNLMAKTFRTSTVVSGSGTTTDLTVYDYSQGKCIRYRFNGGNLQRTQTSTSFSTSCNAGSDWKNISTGNVSGNFYVTASSDGNMVGKITTSIVLTHNNQTVQTQTTSSLRDYTISGIELQF